MLLDIPRARQDKYVLSIVCLFSPKKGGRRCAVSPPSPVHDGSSCLTIYSPHPGGFSCLRLPMLLPLHAYPGRCPGLIACCSFRALPWADCLLLLRYICAQVSHVTHERLLPLRKTPNVSRRRLLRCSHSEAPPRLAGIAGLSPAT